MTKKCMKCGAVKRLVDFYRKKDSADGLRGACKHCLSAYGAKYNSDNRARMAAVAAKWYAENKGRAGATAAKWYAENKGRVAANSAKRHAENRERVSDTSAKWYAANREHVAATGAKWKAENQEHRVFYNAKWYAENKGRSAATGAKNRAARIKTDPAYALRIRISALIRQSLTKKGHTKNSSTAEILGCTAAEFATHIERQFTISMTWENRDQWHIDHIVPVSSAGDDEAQILRLSHYLNLRPMWAEDNLKKSNKRTYLI